MDKLESLKQKIYSRGFLGRKRHEHIPPEEMEEKKEPWLKSEAEKKAEEERRKRHKIISGLLGIIFGFSILFGLAYAALRSGVFFYFLGRAEVEVSIIAPTEIIAGDRVVYSVVYKNNSKYPIVSGELTFVYPKGAEVFGGAEEIETGTTRVTAPIAAIAPGEEAHADFIARVFGKEGDDLAAEATLVYEPQNIRSKFTIKKSATVKIVRVPIVVSFSGDSKILSGDIYSFTLEYASNATGDFKNTALRVVYPEGFRFQESDRTPQFKDSKGALWDLGTVQSGSSGSIRVVGTMTGVALEPKTFQYAIGALNAKTHELTPYIERTAVSEIIEQALSVQTFVNGKKDATASLGDFMNVSIKIKNNSSVPLQNISLGMTIEGPFDPGSLRPRKGAVAGAGRVEWTSVTDGTLKRMDPGEEREEQLSFNIKRNEAASSIKNAAITMQSIVKAEKTESVDFEPRGTDALTVPINAVPLFQAKALYSGSRIRNSGPIPPKVGQRTTYAIVWEIESAGGDLSDVRIKAALPPYVQWENEIVPPSESIAYQKSTGEIIWNPGLIRAGIGEDARRVMFKVSFMPTESSVNTIPVLVQSILGTAIDVFTNEDLKITVRDITTDLTDDFGVPSGSGIVRP